MTIAENYARVQERVVRAASQAERPLADITLVAVTKTWPAAVVIEAYEAGMRHFGENRTQELAQKRAEVEAVLGADSGIVWHQIGVLQSRQTKVVADQADVFHALDRLKIARRLSKQLVANGRELPVFMEVNVSGEETKSGFEASQWEQDATQQENLRIAVAEIAKLPGLQLTGLMTMAPWDSETADIQTVFHRTRELSAWLQAMLPHLALHQLSMGMTDDFEIAIREGATHIRVGRAIFGSRH